MSAWTDAGFPDIRFRSRYDVFWSLRCALQERTGTFSAIVGRFSSATYSIKEFAQSFDNTMREYWSYYLYDDPSLPYDQKPFLNKDIIEQAIGESLIALTVLSSSSDIERWCIQRYKILNLMYLGRDADIHVRAFPHKAWVKDIYGGSIEECLASINDFSYFYGMPGAYTLVENNYCRMRITECSKAYGDVTINGVTYTVNSPGYMILGFNRLLIGRPVRVRLHYIAAPFSGIEFFHPGGYSENEHYCKIIDAVMPTSSNKIITLEDSRGRIMVSEPLNTGYEEKFRGSSIDYSAGGFLYYDPPEVWRRSLNL